MRTESGEMYRFWLARQDYMGGVPMDVWSRLKEDFGGFIEASVVRTVAIKGQSLKKVDCVEYAFLVTPENKGRLSALWELLEQQAKKSRHQPFIDLEGGGKVERIYAK